MFNEDRRQRFTPGEQGCGCLKEEEHNKEAVKSLVEGSSSASLFTFGHLSCSFSTPDLP